MKTNPEVGDRVSMQHVADRYPGTVVAVSPSGHTVTVRRDRAMPSKNSQPMSNQWDIYEDPTGIEEKYTRRKDGSYRHVGSSHPYLVSGWSHYHSYEF